MEASQTSISFIIISLILSTICICTIIGNFFVIVAILIDKNLQTNANQLVLSLAVADLMVACLVMPLGAYNDIHQGWYLGKEICEFWTSADVLCCTASILNLLAIAIDRYWAVTNVDYIYKRTRRRVNLMILCAWTVGAIVSLAPIFGWKDPNFAERVLIEHKCLVSQDVAYQVFATISTFYAPLVLLLALYWRIFQIARKRIRRRPGQGVGGNPSTRKLNVADVTTNATALAPPNSDLPSNTNTIIYGNNHLQPSGLDSRIARQRLKLQPGRTRQQQQHLQQQQQQQHETPLTLVSSSSLSHLANSSSNHLLVDACNHDTNKREDNGINNNNTNNEPSNSNRLPRIVPLNLDPSAAIQQTSDSLSGSIEVKPKLAKIFGLAAEFSVSSGQTETLEPKGSLTGAAGLRWLRALVSGRLARVGGIEKKQTVAVIVESAPTMVADSTAPLKHEVRDEVRVGVPSLTATLTQSLSSSQIGRVTVAQAADHNRTFIQGSLVVGRESGEKSLALMEKSPPLIPATTNSKVRRRAKRTTKSPLVLAANALMARSPIIELPSVTGGSSAEDLSENLNHLSSMKTSPKHKTNESFGKGLGCYASSSLDSSSLLEVTSGNLTSRCSCCHKLATTRSKTKTISLQSEFSHSKSCSESEVRMNKMDDDKVQVVVGDYNGGESGHQVGGEANANHWNPGGQVNFVAGIETRCVMAATTTITNSNRTSKRSKENNEHLYKNQHHHNDSNSNQVTFAPQGVKGDGRVAELCDRDDDRGGGGCARIPKSLAMSCGKDENCLHLGRSPEKTTTTTTTDSGTSGATCSACKVSPAAPVVAATLTTSPKLAKLDTAEELGVFVAFGPRLGLARRTRQKPDLQQNNDDHRLHSQANCQDRRCVDSNRSLEDRDQGNLPSTSGHNSESSEDLGVATGNLSSGASSLDCCCCCQQCSCQAINSESQLPVASNVGVPPSTLVASATTASVSRKNSTKLKLHTPSVSDLGGGSPCAGDDDNNSGTSKTSTAIKPNLIQNKSRSKGGGTRCSDDNFGDSRAGFESTKLSASLTNQITLGKLTSEVDCFNGCGGGNGGGGGSNVTEPSDTDISYSKKSEKFEVQINHNIDAYGQTDVLALNKTTKAPSQPKTVVQRRRQREIERPEKAATLEEGDGRMLRAGSCQHDIGGSYLVSCSEALVTQATATSVASACACSKSSGQILNSCDTFSVENLDATDKRRATQHHHLHRRLDQHCRRNHLCHPPLPAAMPTTTTATITLTLSTTKTPPNLAWDLASMLKSAGHRVAHSVSSSSTSLSSQSSLHGSLSSVKVVKTNDVNEVAGECDSDATGSSEDESVEMSSAFPVPLRESSSPSQMTVAARFELEESEGRVPNVDETQIVESHLRGENLQSMVQKDEILIERENLEQVAEIRPVLNNKQLQQQQQQQQQQPPPPPPLVTLVASKTTSRTLDLKRKFRALGQLVSFVQTSRHFNSSSSMPSDDELAFDSCNEESINGTATSVSNKNNNNKLASQRNLANDTDKINSIISIGGKWATSATIAMSSPLLSSSSSATLTPMKRETIGGNSDGNCSSRVANRPQTIPNLETLMAQLKSNNNKYQSGERATDVADIDADVCQRHLASSSGLVVVGGRAPAALTSAAMATAAATASAMVPTKQSDNGQSHSRANRGVSRLMGEKSLVPSENENQRATRNKRLNEAGLATAAGVAGDHQRHRQSSSTFSMLHNNNTAGQLYKAPPTHTAQSTRRRRENLDMKREKKAAKTLAIITGVFVCCWLPFFVNALLMAICGQSCTPSDLILSILLWLGYLNSLLNPIIYTIFSPDFRRAFRRLLCWQMTDNLKL